MQREINATEKFRRTPKGVLTNLYSKMRVRNKNKGFGDLSFTLVQFHSKCLNDKKYISLFNEWVNSDFDMKMKPSVDRINPLVGYEISNMQFKTWGENRKKADWEKSFIYTTPITMLDMNGNLIREFGSTKEAVQATGFSQGNITSCCQGKRNHVHGYVFRYKGNKFKKPNVMNPELLGKIN